MYVFKGVCSEEYLTALLYRVGHSRLILRGSRLCPILFIVGCNSKTSLDFLPKGMVGCLDRVILKLTSP